MKRLQTISVIILLIISFQLKSQELERIDTKDLTHLSNIVGLDSVISLLGGLPLYYIDSITTKDLALQIKDYVPTNRIEYFLTDYCLHSSDSELGSILINFFTRRLDEVKDYTPNQWGYMPEFDNDALLSLTKHKQNETEELLIKYYEAWDLKSLEYKDLYESGLQESNRQKKERLINPLKYCHHNCNMILAALKTINSPFATKSKFESHQKYLEDYSKVESLFDHFEFENYNTTAIEVTMPLATEKSLGEIDFNKYPVLAKIIEPYCESYCWKTLLYNGPIGFLDIGCQSKPLEGVGELLRLEIKENKLLIYGISSWVS